MKRAGFRMNTRRFLVFCGWLTLACAGPRKTSDPAVDSEADADVDSDADVLYEGDESGECEDGADNDRDGDFDCDDDGCLNAPSCTERGISGDSEGMLRLLNPTTNADCTGTFSMTWNPVSGEVVGSTSCFSPNEPLDGTITGTSFEGIWSATFRGRVVEVPLSGELRGSAFDVTAALEGPEGYASGSLHGTVD